MPSLLDLIVLPAGLHALGLEEPALILPLGSPPSLIAEKYNAQTPRDVRSILEPADVVDAQVQLAFAVARETGEAVETVGQRFADIRKNDESAPTQIATEARRVLDALVRQGDVSISKITVEEAGDDGRLLTVDYVNLRAPKGDATRQVQRTI